MNLLEIRQHFIKKSGRFDLATTSTGSAEQWDIDNGANFYIQSACRALDRAQEQAEGYYEQNAAIGDYYIDLPDCRQVSRITFINSDGEESESLGKMDISAFLEEYPALGGEDTGAPLHWSIYPRVRPPRQKFLGPKEDIQAIAIMPPTDEAIIVRIYGKFFSATLENDMDENFWSVNHPDVLIRAALREIEVDYRNTQGYNDFSRYIDDQLLGIDKDLAAADAADIIEMEG
jgi:hypothetical protein